MYLAGLLFSQCVSRVVSFFPLPLFLNFIYLCLASTLKKKSHNLIAVLPHSNYKWLFHIIRGATKVCISSLRIEGRQSSCCCLFMQLSNIWAPAPHWRSAGQGLLDLWRLLLFEQTSLCPVQHHLSHQECGKSQHTLAVVTLFSPVPLQSFCVLLV